MDDVLTVLILLLLTALSGVLDRAIPALPLPLVQIGIGALLALPKPGLHVSFDPDLFMLLFIPPLLFADGWRIPKRELILERGPVLTLAIGLVVFTVLGLGYFVHWMIPAIPLEVAFVLGAVLSPTDAVAVSAISGRVAVPPRLLHILEGEALLNDASGLVAMNFAIAAALTGHFSFVHAAGSFVLVSAGGIVIGGAVAWMFSWVRDALVGWYGEDPSMQIVLLQLLLPFAVYLIAEHLNVSGILAAVAAGMMVNHTDLQRSGHIVTRMQSRAVWGMVEFALNGAIFLLLGFQLPKIIGKALWQAAHTAGIREMWTLLGYFAAISLAVILLRFLWVLGASAIYGALQKKKGKPNKSPSLRIMITASLAGIRGAITLAAVLSVPLVMPDGSPFPARDLLIFLATGVILCSLVGGSIGLPILLRGIEVPAEGAHVREEREARLAAAEAAIHSLEQRRRKRADEFGDHPIADSDAALYTEVTLRLMRYYEQRIGITHANEDHHQQALRVNQFETELRLAALQAEREELYRLRTINRINDETLRSLVREIDIAEVATVSRSPARHR